MKIGSEIGWQVIVPDNLLLYRYLDSVAAVKANKIIIFGGYSNKGFIFDTQSREVKEILGQDQDFTYFC